MLLGVAFYPDSFSMTHSMVMITRIRVRLPGAFECVEIVHTGDGKTSSILVRIYWAIKNTNYLAILTTDTDRLQEQIVQLIPCDFIITRDRLDQLINLINGSIQIIVDNVDTRAKTNLWSFHLQPQ